MNKTCWRKIIISLGAFKLGSSCIECPQSKALCCSFRQYYIAKWQIYWTKESQQLCKIEVQWNLGSGLQFLKFHFMTMYVKTLLWFWCNFESCHYLFQSLIFLSSVDISLFQELEQCYGIKFLQTEEIYLYQSFRKQSTEFLFETLSDWDDYVEVDILTKFHSL